MFLQGPEFSVISFTYEFRFLSLLVYVEHTAFQTLTAENKHRSSIILFFRKSNSLKNRKRAK